MKQTQTQDIRTNTQVPSARAEEAKALPVRRGPVLGRGLWPKAGVLGLLLGLPLGAGLLMAGQQPQYRFTEIPVPGPSLAVGINDRGLVTGYYGDPTAGDVLSFVSERGVVTTGIAAPGATITSVGGANNRGLETGNYGDLTHQQAGLYDIRRGTFTPLPEIPGLPFNMGDGINDLGHASGVAYASGDWINGGAGLGQNWIWNGRHYSFFTVPGAVNGAVAGGINNRDQVTGFYVDSSGVPQGFVKDGQNYTTIAAPGAYYTFGTGINNQGVLAGAYGDASGHHGFIWSKGKLVTVDAPIPGSLGTGWYYVNDHGDLAGLYMDASQVFRAVIAERVEADAD
jgi:hypothetical protein